jgi:hypothetical protein
MRDTVRAIIDPHATARGTRPKALMRLDHRELIVLVVLAAAALLFFAPIFFPLAAQASAREKDEEPRPARLWYGLTVGGAGTRLTCDLCQDTRDVAPAFAVSVGVHARARLRVGLEASRWTYEEDEVRERVHTVGLVAHLVPNASRGFYLLGGAGWSGYRSGEFSYDAPRLTVGLGWDVPFTGDWVVGNLIALDAAAFAPIRNEDVTVMRNVGMSTVRVAVQLQRR